MRGNLLATHRFETWHYVGGCCTLASQGLSKDLLDIYRLCTKSASYSLFHFTAREKCVYASGARVLNKALDHCLLYM